MKNRVCFLSVSLLTVSALLLPMPTFADKPGPPGQEKIEKVASAVTASQIGQAARARIESSYGKLPLSFEPNHGQSGEAVKFLSRGRGYALFLTNDEAVFVFGNVTTESAKNGEKAGTKNQVTKPTVLRMKLAGANQNAQVIGLNELPGKSNYLLGKNPKKWRTNVPNFAKVQYQHVYPGIDLVYYGYQRQLEYDFVVAPGADPTVITLEISGAKGVSPAKLADNGDLIIKTEDGEVRFHKPIVYQTESSKAAAPGRKTVQGHFVLLAENKIGFEVSSYDATKPLYIDPEISYGTFLGGGGWEAANGIAVDGEGNAYVTGMVFDSTFPVTPGAYDSTCGTESDGLCNGAGGTWFSDAFVTKLSSDGASLVYSTYLGGSDGDSGNGIALDASGNAIVTGATASSDFPTVNPFQDHFGGGLCGAQPCSDGFLTKLNASGSALVYSTYLGGSNADSGQRVAVDGSGSAYLIGVTQSADFPTLNALQSVFGGGTCGSAENPSPCLDAFVAKIDAAGSAIYSTYLGGSSDDGGWHRGIAVDDAGSAYVTSTTASADFPVTTGAYQTELTGLVNAFVTKLSPSGTSLAYSTYLGGTLADLGFAIAVDESGSAYVTGPTYSQDFPTTPGAFDTSCGTDGLCDGMYDGYVAKLNPDGSALVYSTYLGGSGGETPYDIAVDSLGIAYVTGSTDSPDFPKEELNLGQRLGQTCGSGDNTYPCPDVFMSKLSVDGDALILSGYLGGSSEDVGLGIALDSSRNVYIAGRTSSTDFPTTEDAYLTTYPTDPGLATAFVLKLSDLAQPRTLPSTESLDFGEQLVGTTSEPQTVIWKNIGDAPEILPPFDVTGDFEFTHTCGESIAPNTSCTGSYTFTPQEIGTRTGEFMVFVEGEWYSAGLSLEGVGVAPLVSLSATSLAFASQTVGSSGDPQTVTLSNGGTYPLTITEIAVSGDFTQTNNCGASVAVGSSCMISVQFSPLEAGDRSGQLTIQGNDPDSPHVVSLSGVGTAAEAPIPAISGLSPAIAVAGGSAFTLIVNGSNFVAASAIMWGSTPLTTQFVSATQLTAQVPAASIASDGTISVSVVTPAPGGGTSNTLKFQVDTAGSSTSPSFSEVTVTVKAGTPATYHVTLPSEATDISVECLNLPAGATCSYTESSSTLSISTAASTPPGTYVITVVFTETLPGTAASIALLPLLLMPFAGRKRRRATRVLLLAVVGLAIAIVAAGGGCGGNGGSSNPTPSPTHQVTSSATVSLVVQ